jgi:hypothetical protein
MSVTRTRAPGLGRGRSGEVPRQMEPGARTPTFHGRAPRLMAFAVTAVCWLSAPAGAQAQQAPALDVTGIAATATAAVASTGSDVESAVTAAAPLAGPAQGAATQVAGTVARVTGPSGPGARVGTSAVAATGSVAERVTRAAAPVAGAVDRIVHETQPAVGPALQGGTTGTERSHIAGSSRAGHLAEPAGGKTSRAARLRLVRDDGAGRRGSSRERSADGPSANAPSLPPVATDLLGAPADLPGFPGASPSAGAAHAALDPPPEPLSGAAGGTSGAGASVSFSVGGLALLLAALCLAGPALRRRLPRRPVIGWPAAFVPLLERPG